MEEYKTQIRMPRADAIEAVLDRAVIMVGGGIAVGYTVGGREVRFEYTGDVTPLEYSEYHIGGNPSGWSEYEVNGLKAPRDEDDGLSLEDDYERWHEKLAEAFNATEKDLESVLPETVEVTVTAEKENSTFVESLPGERTAPVKEFGWKELFVGLNQHFCGERN